MKSLRARLILLLSLGLGAVWGLGAWWGHMAARHEVDEMMDAQLAQAAQALVSTAQHEMHERVEHGDAPGRDLLLPVFHQYEQKILFHIWDEQGRLLMRSAGAPEVMSRQAAEGYGVMTIRNEPWRVLSRHDSHTGIWVQVAEPQGKREWLARHIAFRILLPLLVLAPVLLMLIGWFVGRGLRPLREISAEIAARAANRLDPLQMETVPDEVTPLALALNNLFFRLQRAFESEQRFTADAAHELRTPLAALKVQAQVALRATDETERREALEKVLQGVDRATRLITQLLTLARVDPDSAAAEHQPLLLRELAAGVAGEMRPLAESRQITLDCAGDEVQVRGDAGQLAVLLRNLLDNALRYTPPGGRVAVVIDSWQSPVLEISDSGPGIAQEQRAQVLERFYRIPGNTQPGSGLGLSIVSRIAEIHGAQLDLGTAAMGGLRVRVKFPRP